MSNRLNRRRMLGTGALALVAALGLAACSPATEPAADKGEGLPSVIKIVAMTDTSGPVAYIGDGNQEGWELAIDEIHESGILGEGVEIELDVRDAAFDPQIAASEMTAALATGDVAAIAGPSVSSEALAIAPIALQKNVPVVFAQSGISGLLSAPGLYRVTPTQSVIWPAATDHIIKNGAKTVSIVNSATNPTYNEVGAKVVPALLEKGNVEVVSSFDFESSASDFQSAASRIAQDNPDVVVTTLIGSQTPTLVVQLRQAGFTGDIYSTDGIAGGILKSTGKDGEGVYFPTSFSPAAPDAADFVEAYTAKFNKSPIVFGADAYNQMWMIARGIAEAGSVDSASVIKGLDAIAAEGFTGAQGVKFSFEDNDARMSGILAMWDGENDVVAK